MLDYQTSPYLLLHKTGKTVCVKNLMNDALLQKESAEWRVLEYCVSPVKSDELIRIFGDKIFEYMVLEQFIMETDHLWQAHRYQYVDIEVTTHCNWRCEYCPNHVYSNAPLFMELSFFEMIVQKLKDYGKIEYVTLNAFNEPTLDRFFINRLQILKQANIKLALMTNGSYLDRKKADAMKECGITEVVWFNLPGVDRDVFKRVTGYDDFEAVMDHIDYCIDIGLNVRFSVQGKKTDTDIALQGIQAKYQKKVKQQIEKWETTDRAGLLTNEYNLGVNITDPCIYGCPTALHNLCIGIGGEIMACFNDYFKESIIGNINDGTLEEIAASQNAICHKQKVFGAMPAEPSFICRKCVRMYHAKLLNRYMESIRTKIQHTGFA